MFPLPILSPLTKVLGGLILALIIALGIALWRYESVAKDLGSTEVLLKAEKRRYGELRDEKRASDMALQALKVENAKTEALLVQNEASRHLLDTRVKTLTLDLKKLGAVRYVTPASLCPTPDHQPTLDDLLDAPLPPELLDRVRVLLAPTRSGGAGGAGTAAPAADAGVPVARVHRDYPAWDSATPR